MPITESPLKELPPQGTILEFNRDRNNIFKWKNGNFRIESTETAKSATFGNISEKEESLFANKGGQHEWEEEMNKVF